MQGENRTMKTSIEQLIYDYYVNHFNSTNSSLDKSIDMLETHLKYINDGFERRGCPNGSKGATSRRAVELWREVNDDEDIPQWLEDAMVFYYVDPRTPISVLLEDLRADAREYADEIREIEEAKKGEY